AFRGSFVVSEDSRQSLASQLLRVVAQRKADLLLVVPLRFIRGALPKEDRRAVLRDEKHEGSGGSVNEGVVAARSRRKHRGKSFEESQAGRQQRSDAHADVFEGLFDRLECLRRRGGDEKAAARADTGHLTEDRRQIRRNAREQLLQLP